MYDTDILIIQPVAGIIWINLYQVKTGRTLIISRSYAKDFGEEWPVSVMRHKPRTSIIHRHLFDPEARSSNLRRRSICHWGRSPHDWSACCLWLRVWVICAHVRKLLPNSLLVLKRIHLNAVGPLNFGEILGFAHWFKSLAKRWLDRKLKLRIFTLKNSGMWWLTTETTVVWTHRVLIILYFHCYF
jgi:hypothetical protein